MSKREQAEGTKFIYQSRNVVSNACSEILENILLETYEQENPFREVEGVIVDKSRTFVYESMTSIDTAIDEKLQPRGLPHPEEQGKKTRLRGSDSLEVLRKSSTESLLDEDKSSESSEMESASTTEDLRAPKRRRTVAEKIFQDVSVQNSMASLLQEGAHPRAQGDVLARYSRDLDANFPPCAKFVAFLLTVALLVTPIFFQSEMWTMFWRLLDAYMNMK